MTYVLDGALARLRVPKRRAWALPVWLHRLPRRLVPVPKPAKSVLGGRDSAGPAPEVPNAKASIVGRPPLPRRRGEVSRRRHVSSGAARPARRLRDDGRAPPGHRRRGIAGAQCPLEKCLALDARDALIKMVVGRNATLDSCAPDKYFRLLCDVSVDGEDGGKVAPGRLRGALQWARAEARLVRVHRRAGAAVRGGARGPVKSRLWSFFCLCVYIRLGSST